jgi:hypothetical protein
MRDFKRERERERERETKRERGGLPQCGGVAAVLRDLRCALFVRGKARGLSEGSQRLTEVEVRGRRRWWQTGRPLLGAVFWCVRWGR